jgi:addiction module RelB/DinJ family antitoxin
MASSTILFRTRVPKARLHRAEKILSRLGLKPGEAFNMLLAQVELREALPFAVTARPGPVLTAEEQAAVWNDSLGAY